MNIVPVSLEATKNYFSIDRAGWSQTARHVGSFVLSHKRELLGITIAFLAVAGAASFVYQQYTDVWPHQLFIANLLYPLRNFVPQKIKGGIERYNSEVYPVHKFTEEDRQELQNWVERVPLGVHHMGGARREIRETIMEEVLAGKKSLSKEVPVNFLRLNVFDKLSHLQKIKIVSGGTKIDLPEAIKKLKNLQTLHLNKLIIPEDFQFAEFPKLECLSLEFCDVPCGLQLENLKHLKKLSLSYNCTLGALPSIPSKNLVSLELCCTLLASVPTAVGGFSKLTFLDLSHNREMKSLPEEIYQLSKKCKILIGWSAIALAPVFQEIIKEGYSGPQFFVNSTPIDEGDYHLPLSENKSHSFLSLGSNWLEIVRELDKLVHDNVPLHRSFREKIIHNKLTDYKFRLGEHMRQDKKVIDMLVYISNNCEAGSPIRNCHFQFEPMCVSDTEQSIKIANYIIDNYKEKYSFSFRKLGPRPLEINLRELVGLANQTELCSSLSIKGFTLRNFDYLDTLSVEKLSIEDCEIL
ncbi:MAG: hypothetical protein SNF33_07195 [Candidatus Algichlamydia australiensis]|nr:hypothetical protein [Chlamydiales bacterium]